MEVKIMVVPGRIARVAGDGFTVLTAAEAAERQIPGVGWVELAKGREVRVQNRKFSNSGEVPEGFAGSISATTLTDGDVVLILIKIKGNGEAVLTCSVNGQEYALETPVEARVVLGLAGVNLADGEKLLVNGEEAELSRLVGGGDSLEVVAPPPPKPKRASRMIRERATEIVTVKIDGHTITGYPEDIRKIFNN